MYQGLVHGAAASIDGDVLRVPGSPSSGPLVSAALGGRVLGRSLSLSLVFHAAVLGALAHFEAPAPATVEPPPVRMIFVEPPPPPLGEPRATYPAPAANQAAKPKATPRRAATKPKPRVAAEKVRPRQSDATALVEPEAVESNAPTSATPQVAAVPTGSPAGVAAGAAGGSAGGAGDAPVPAGLVATAPALLRRVAPEYPKSVRQQGVEGLVVVEAILDREGRVEPEVRMVRSIPRLDAYAIAAIRQWRFRPARNPDGSPVRVLLEIPIQFVLR